MSDYGYPPEANRQSNTLIADEQWEEALTRWVKHAEPRALSLWLLGCLRHIAHPASAQLLDEMQRWYAEPDEKLRWQIFHHAEILGFDTPVGALALALFWSQGSISPEGLEPVYPEPHLSAEMRRCVLLMLATSNTDNPAVGTRRLLAQWTQEKA
jgi:hypothetical protein